MCNDVQCSLIATRNLLKLAIMSIADNRMVVLFTNKVTMARVLVGQVPNQIIVAQDQYAPMKFLFSSDVTINNYCRPNAISPRLN